MSDLKISRKAPAGAAGQARAEVAALSPRGRLRAHRERLAKGSVRAFVLPGYDATNEALGGQLVARYRRLLFDELAECFRRERWLDEHGEYDVVAANAQFLVDSCDDIFIREPDGTNTPLVEGHKTTYEPNLKSGQSLGTIMGVELLPSLREQMVAEFGDNELTLNTHSGEVHLWMISVNQTDTEAALGEA